MNMENRGAIIVFNKIRYFQVFCNFLFKRIANKYLLTLQVNFYKLLLVNMNNFSTTGFSITQIFLCPNKYKILNNMGNT